ncbi:MAG: leucine-rich repeat protein [Erysipelotrichales bacterium]|nr:leucine-rich repeat protein [Erysipelotrichales bacterium]
MRKQISKIIVSLMMLLGCVSYVADVSKVSAVTTGTCGEGCEFTIDGDTITFSGEGRVYNGMPGQIYDGVAINAALKALTVSEKVYIDGGKYTYRYYIPGVKNIVIEEGITNVDYMAYLDEVENVTIPSTLIGYGFLRHLPSWENIEITNPENSKMAVKDNILYSKDLTTIYKFPAKYDSIEYIIPEHVTTLGNFAFDNTEIKKITINEHVSNISFYAFYGSAFKTVYTTSPRIAEVYEAAKEYAKGLTKIAYKQSNGEYQEYYAYEREHRPAFIFAQRYDEAIYPKLVYTEPKEEEPETPVEEPTVESEMPKEEAKADLSSYSKMDMNVYPGSRVTKLQATATGFSVEGYMFETNADCIYNDARNWREIVFVNTEDYSTTKAYRNQVTAVYNTWLNKNMTATNNGTYKLNYANYKVEVNPKNINLYAGNVAGHSMNSGSYYVYMRISNGKTSYLYPLRDATLSDGSNMESKGTLPSGFTVSDDGNRTLIYTVK